MPIPIHRGRSKWSRHRFQVRGQLSHLKGHADPSVADISVAVEQPISVHLACLEACQSCHAMCLHNVGNGLLRGDDPGFLAQVGLLLETADLCGLTAEVLRRNSQCAALLCAACAELCLASAKVLEGAGEPNECAAACWQCAASCAQFSELSPREFMATENPSPERLAP